MEENIKCNCNCCCCHDFEKLECGCEKCKKCGVYARRQVNWTWDKAWNNGITGSEWQKYITFKI